jgi:hypothetical protein
LQWAHIAAGSLCGQALCTAANLRGNTSAAAWCAVLRPFSSAASLAPRVLPSSRRGAKDASAAADAFVAASGLAFSAALACAASRVHEAAAAGGGGGGAATTLLGSAACAGAWICLLGAAASDGGDVLALLCRGGGLQARARAPLPRSACAAPPALA